MWRFLCIGLTFVALAATGCSHSGSRADSQIVTDVQSKISSDNSIADKQITITANQGVVTLSGAVSSDAVRTAAAADAAQVEGVKTVVNNLEVASTSAAAFPPPSPQTASPQPNSAPVSSAGNSTRPPAARFRDRSSPRRYGDSDNGWNGDAAGLRTAVPSDAGNPGNPGSDTSPVAAAPAPPPAPAPPQKATIPAGTQFNIRVNEELSSEKAQVGDTFRGSISAPITVDDQTVVPMTADVEGRVVDVKSAGRFAGGSLLTLQLTRLMMNGRSYSISTDQWSKSGTGRGKGTAAKVGGGAALGAVLGGIFGGGKGAAIGTVAGAGAGTAGSAVGQGQQIVLKPESTISFTLQNSLIVTPGANRQDMR